MYAQVDKPKENKSRAVANSVGQKKSNERQGLGFVDNRPEKIAQKKMREVANSYTSKNKQAIQLMNETYRNQPLITNYFGVLTNSTFEETNLPFHFNQHDIEIEGEGHDFSASVTSLGTLGELELYDSGDGKKWINQIHVDDRAKRRGIGTALLQAAIDQHTVIYASIQAAAEDSDGDSRHLTDEGEVLVNACILNGMNIIKTYPGMDMETDNQ